MDEERLQQLRTANLGRMLLALATDFRARALSRMQQRGFEQLTESQKVALVHLGLQGARLTELAARAGITKQSMGALVAQLESQGLLDRVPDPDDGRARRIVFTARGREALAVGLQAVEEVEGEYAALIGAQDAAHLRRICTSLTESLGLEPPP